MAGGQKGRLGGAVTHGHAKGVRSKEYRTWLSMRRRCREHPYYVSNGITVCESWQRSFEAFLAHIGPAPSEQHSIDRYPDPKGDYEPGNVRWATKAEQSGNRRPDARSGRHWLGKRRPDIAGANCKLAKLSEADAAEIRSARGAGVKVNTLAARFNVTRQTITNVTSGRSFRETLR